MKKIIAKHLLKILAIVMTFSLVVISIYQVVNCQVSMQHESDIIFDQISQILSENTEDLSKVIEEYKQTSLKSAEAVAHIIQNEPDVADNTEELKKIAELLEIDEIHIFNAHGVIISGSEPNYWGLSMSDGEQVGFFKPMLTNKNMKICQDVTPNTAENKQMQYSAVWSEDGNFIIQVGNEPGRILDATRKNDLSYIFSLLTTDDGYELYAANRNDATILGSTNKDATNKTLFDIGIENTNNLDKFGGFHATVDGVFSYCNVREMDSIVIVRTCSAFSLYKIVISYSLLMLLYLSIIVVVLLFSSVKYLDKHIITSINTINSQLSTIAEGNFDTDINVKETPEFEELSSHINSMVDSILSTTDKISYILDSADMEMGVYEYTPGMKKVRATKHTAEVLNLDKKAYNLLLSDYELLEQYLEEIKKNKINGYDDIYYLDEGHTRYVKLLTYIKDGFTMGVVTNMTKEMTKHKNLMNERDIDVLTNLLNRRGIERKLDELFNEPEALKHSALIMLDADGLKQVNDKYGHNIGDLYLCSIADSIQTVNPPYKLVSRQGGDEFVLFFYGCETHEELVEYINQLSSIRGKRHITLPDGSLLEVQFSIGWVFCHESKFSYENLLEKADELMYAEKQARKAERKNS